VPITINTLLPALTSSLDGVGFVFGAGTSVEAGYPTTQGLTQLVIGQLESAERSVLAEILGHAGTSYDPVTCSPNIESICDYVIAHAITTGDTRSSTLEQRVRSLIVETLVSVANPTLDHHIRFFEALKSRSFGLPARVWIFTTNYDVLLETAAALTGVHLDNGFSGTTTRFFDIASLSQVRGTTAGSLFTPNPQLEVKLIKLHGSLSWAVLNGRLVEQHPRSLEGEPSRVMILPRRRKVIDTLAPPYDQLFALSARILGHECRYLMAIGSSLGDSHINDALLIPALRSNRCSLTMLSQEEPTTFSDFRSLPSVTAVFSSGGYASGQVTPDGTDLWRFSSFVSAL
jgi:SIR2-like domain